MANSEKKNPIAVLCELNRNAMPILIDTSVKHSEEYWIAYGEANREYSEKVKREKSLKATELPKLD